MPFVHRVVGPVYLSRRSLGSGEDEDGGASLLTDYELDTVTNYTLSNALRQLASLVVIANDIFDDLSKELHHVCVRANKLRTRIQVVDEKVQGFDPKKVTVPEGDLCSFSLRSVHFSSSHQATTGLFTAESRPNAVKCLYQAAAKTPVHVMRQLDRYRRDGHRSSRFFMCTPVLGQRRKNKASKDIDIETHTPAAVAELRRWTSTEALGDVTVAPDCSARVLSTVEDSQTDHRLPSPEEQVQAVASHFPPELVPVDVSGRAFLRMSLLRRSLALPEGEGTVRRRQHGTRRRPRGRRRNTIAGTDRNELRQAVIGESLDDSQPADAEPLTTLDDLAVVRSASTDLVESSSPPDTGKKSHFNSLKQWLKLAKSSPPPPQDDAPSNIYEMVRGGSLKKKPSLHHSLPISTPSPAMAMAVKMRCQAPRRRSNAGKDEPAHSSSGNWSASSESGRTSIGSEHTATTHQPKSTTTTTSSSSSSLHPLSSVCSRRKFVNTTATSTSSSVSEGTLTPDIIPDLGDGETSSVYSCDTEGYYTSFHMDSGLKTLKEEDGLATSPPATPMHSTTALSNGNYSPNGRGSSTLTAENEYELFGKGSTSTTTSSAGTVCTTLMVGINESNLSLALAPAVPERKSSLDDHRKTSTSTNSQMVIAMVHTESPDSGHNTSSSPVDSACSPHGRNGSEYEFSESDLEGVDRIERIRVKTTINSSRIPSMCVITPPVSDDETSLSSSHYVPSSKKTRVPSPTTTDRNNFLETDFGTKNIHNLKLVIPKQNNNNNKVLEKQVSTESERSSEADTVKAVSPVRQVKSHMNGSYPNKDDHHGDDGTLKANVATVQHHSKFPMNPFNNVIDKVRGVLSHKKAAAAAATSKPAEEVDAGDYVTIADVRDTTRRSQPTSPVYSNNDVMKPTNKVALAIRDTEYVSLNELPVSRHSTSPTNVLVSPSTSDSLERKRRQGARVTLDSEGKVVYSSDSLRRNKGSHTTFEPGPYVKESTAVSPTASPMPSHRVPKSNIRPVTLLSQGRNGSANIQAYSKPSSPVQRKSNSPSRSKPTSPTSPLLGKVIIRPGGKSRVASPTSTMPIISASTTARPMSPQSARGAYVNMQQQQQADVEQRTSATTDEDEEGHSSVYNSRQQAPPPKYISPPPVEYSGPPGYWTLPGRQRSSSEDGGAGRFSTWGRASQPSSRPTPAVIPSVPYSTPTNRPSFSTPTNRPSYSTPTKSQMYAGVQPSTPTKKQSYGTDTRTPGMQASTPTKRDTNVVGLQASTPTKKATNAMDMSVALSPIQRLLSPPKSSMTAEQLFAAIHKSKRRMNIKTDADAFSRSASPSCSSMASLSPGSSESSINGNRNGNGKPETGTFPENVGRNRHSWSPNSQDVADDRGYLEQHTPPPPAGSRQSWACDRLGPTQQTSMNDFKRLLLQHGPKSGPSTGGGSSGGRMSAAEQLRLSRQQQRLAPTPPPPSVAPAMVNGGGGYTPRSPAEKRTNGSKLLNSPRSLATWRFASPRTDVLSSTILEDRAEEEKAANSPTQESSEPAKSTPVTSHSSSVRRPLNLSFNESPKELPSSRKEPLKSSDISAILQQYRQQSSPKSRNESQSATLLQNHSGSPPKSRNPSAILQQYRSEASPKPVENHQQYNHETPQIQSKLLQQYHRELAPKVSAGSPQNRSTFLQQYHRESPAKVNSEPLQNQSAVIQGNHSESLARTRIEPLQNNLQQYRRESSPKISTEPLRNHSAVLQGYQRESPVKTVQSNGMAHKVAAGNHRTMSPSSAKENVNTNRQTSSSPVPSHMTATQLANYKARQMFLQQPTSLGSQQPRIQAANFYNSQHASPGRSILASIDTKSPSKSTLETAL